MAEKKDDGTVRAPSLTCHGQKLDPLQIDEAHFERLHRRIAEAPAAPDLFDPEERSVRWILNKGGLDRPGKDLATVRRDQRLRGARLAAPGWRSLTISQAYASRGLYRGGALPPEDRLKGLPPEDRLKGLSIRSGGGRMMTMAPLALKRLLTL